MASGPADPGSGTHGDGIGTVDRRAVNRVLRRLAALGVSVSVFWAGAALPDAALKHAASLVEEERYFEAREALDPLLTRQPDHPRLRLMHGVLRMREGKPTEAIEIFERLRQDHPDMYEASNNLAVLYGEQGRLDDALKTVLAALERRPEALLYANLGDVYMGLARRAWNEAQQLGAGKDAPRQAGGEGMVAGLPENRLPAARPQPPCVRTTAFEKRGAADNVAQWMRSHGLEAVKVRRDTRQEIRGHQVYLAPLAGRAEAIAKIREIRQRRVSDIAIISTGALTNGVSLGVYRNKKNMRRRVAEVRRLGYPALSRTLTRALGVYVVEARVTGDRAALNAAWSSRFPGSAPGYAACG